MSLDMECDWRLTNLYKDSHIWLIKASTNVTKNAEYAADLVSDLYLYLHNNKKKQIFWGNSYNLIYCQRYLQSRWLSKRKLLQRFKYSEDMNDYDKEVDEYDYDKDFQMMEAYDNVISELTKLKGTKLFARATIFEMYMLSDDKMLEVAKKIGISKSTTFSCIKKIKQHLKETIKNPFGNE
jgi:hypothetical protein